MITIRKAAGIIIQNRRLLVAREFGKSVFVSPGGAVRRRENIKRSLARELQEETGIIVLEKEMHPFGTFTAIAANDPDKMVRIDTFIVSSWKGDFRPGSEVEELSWVSSDNLSNLSLGSIFEHEVIPRLKEEGLID